MRNRILAAVTMAATLITLVGSGTVAAADHAGTVYTETNSAGANAVVAYDRRADGSLRWSAAYATGGRGTGAGLGSQGALALSSDGRWLVAVNAGSNDVSAFAVRPDGSLRLTGRVAAGGTDPISVTIHGDLVYVLDAGGAGNIAGLRLGFFGRLAPLAGSHQPLSGAGTSPEQIGFSPDGSVLAVAEKGANLIVTYRVGFFGRAGAPHAQASVGAAPYGFDFDARGHLLITEAASSALSSYRVSRRGGLGVISASVLNGQGAACWIALSGDGREAFTIDAGTATISSYAVHADGSLALDQADAAGTGAGTKPLDAIVGGHDLYVLVTGTQQIATFAIGAHGALAATGVIAAPTAAATGLVAR